jgi:hypothetical protein
MQEKLLADLLIALITALLGSVVFSHLLGCIKDLDINM